MDKDSTTNRAQPQRRRGARLAVAAAGLAMLLAAGAALAYDPPQRIWQTVAPRNVDNDYFRYFHDWTWLGDQNDDGCDELLVAHEPYDYPYRRYLPHANRVELYYGGEPMDTIPGLVFHAWNDSESVGRSISYLGNLTGNGPYDFAITKGVHDIENHQGDLRIWYIDIYQGGEQFDTIPDFRIDGKEGAKLMNFDKPCDINGDGYDDLCAWIRWDYWNGPARWYVFYGGPEFDVFPDDSLISDDGFGLSYKKINGNVDGAAGDDLFIWQLRYDERANLFMRLRLFSGGEHLRYEPLFTYIPDSIEGYNQIQADCYGGVGDVNQDGHGDWLLGLNYGRYPNIREAIWLFYGSDSLDTIPDRFPDPDPNALGAGVPHGGDINGDGRGDLIYKGGRRDYGDIRAYLGSHWFDERWAMQLPADDEWRRGMFAKTQGAYADFNGDGAGDFAVLNFTGIEFRSLIIYPGSRDWELDIKSDEAVHPPGQFSLAAFPNPFNARTSIEFQLPTGGGLRFSIMDASGRMVVEGGMDGLKAGRHRYHFNAAKLPSGVYGLKARFEGRSGTVERTLKLVQVK